MKRNDVIQLRVSPEEKAQIEQAAKDQGLSVSQFLRKGVALADYRGTGSRVIAKAETENPVSNNASSVPSQSPKRKPRTCPRHPDAGKLKSRGKTYCAAPLCHVVLADQKGHSSL